MQGVAFVWNLQAKSRQKVFDRVVCLDSVDRIDSNDKDFFAATRERGYCDSKLGLTPVSPPDSDLILLF